MARENPTRTPTGILTFLGGLVLLVIFALLVMYWVKANGAPDEVSSRRAAARIATREQLTKKYQDQLGSTGWTDKAKGAVHIPIAEAMKLAVVELKSKKVGASTVKVEPPLPVVVPDPKATEPGPPALPSAPSGAQTMSFETVLASGPTPKAIAPAAAAAPAAPPTAPAVPAQPPHTPPAPSAPPQPPATGAPAAPVPPTPTAPSPAPAATPAVPAADTPAKPAGPTVPGNAQPPVNLVPTLNPGAPASARGTPPQSAVAPPAPLTPTGVTPPANTSPAPNSPPVPSAPAPNAPAAPTTSPAPAQ
jgi:hypothetical protein